MPDSSREPKTGILSRREALKALAAATGALVLSNLPNAWKTPVVEVGVLPAHAQGASGAVPVVSNLQGQLFGCNGTITFLYNDPRGQVTNASIVSGTLLNQSFGGPVSNGGFFNGSGFNGTITYGFNLPGCESPCGNANGTVRLIVNGRQSNLTGGTILAECLG